MRKKSNFFVERTEEDDILDALSLRINETLKTEKKIDDKKNNVYFWLFKFIVLILYLLCINLIFEAIESFGVAIIYYIGISLRSVFSTIFKIAVDLSQGIISLYILFKNLKIFMNSTYYKRLYSKDKEMNNKKKKFFNTIYLILKYLSIPFLLFAAFSATTLLVILVMFGYLLINGIYSIGAISVSICLFIICYLLFKAIQNKFFDSKTVARKKSFSIMFILLFLSIIVFGYEVGNYEYNSSLPYNFNLETKEMSFDISKKDKIVIKSESKYENIALYTDDTLNGEIRVELEYYKTAEASYTYYFSNTDDLAIKFSSKMNFEIEDFDSILKLGIETLRSKMMYNYNLFKYPNIRVYASTKDAEKISILKYNESLKSSIEE